MLRDGYEPLFIDMYAAPLDRAGPLPPGRDGGEARGVGVPYAALLGSAAAARYTLGVGLEPVANPTPALAARTTEAEVASTVAELARS